MIMLLVALPSTFFTGKQLRYLTSSSEVKTFVSVAFLPTSCLPMNKTSISVIVYELIDANASGDVFVIFIWTNQPKFVFLGTASNWCTGFFRRTNKNISACLFGKGGAGDGFFKKSEVQKKKGEKKRLFFFFFLFS